MRAKGFASELVDQVLDQLGSEGAQSDRRYAESLIRHRIEQGYGPHRIQADLQRFGIGERDGPGLECDWAAVIDKVHCKKYGATKPSSVRERESRRRFLLQRGFGSEQVQQLFRRLGAETDPFE